MHNRYVLYRYNILRIEMETLCVDTYYNLSITVWMIKMFSSFIWKYLMRNYKSSKFRQVSRILLFNLSNTTKQNVKVSSDLICQAPSLWPEDKPCPSSIATPEAVSFSSLLKFRIEKKKYKFKNSWRKKSTKIDAGFDPVHI